MGEKLTLVMYPRIGETRCAVNGKWAPGQETPSGGGWTVRDKHTLCGKPTEGEYTWIKPWSEVTCDECKTQYAAERLQTIELGEDGIQWHRNDAGLWVRSHPRS